MKDIVLVGRKAKELMTPIMKKLQKETEMRRDVIIKSPAKL